MFHDESLLYNLLKSIPPIVTELLHFSVFIKMHMYGQAENIKHAFFDGHNVHGHT